LQGVGLPRDAATAGLAGQQFGPALPPGAPAGMPEPSGGSPAGFGGAPDVSGGLPGATSGASPATIESSEHVRWLQSSLNQVLSLQLPVNGIVGPETRSAVRSFQERNGLPADGFAGPDTVQALAAARRAGAPGPATAGLPSGANGGPAAIGSAPAATPTPGGPAEQAGEYWLGETGPVHTTPASTRSIDQLRANIIRVAEQEHRRWNQGGKKHEGDPQMAPVVQDYWRRGVGQNYSPDVLRNPAFQKNNPWSAAFISWVMREAGAGNAFPYSSAHARYIVAAKRNRQGNNGNPFKAYRISEVRPQPGDLVCRRRAGGNTTYDNVQSGHKTHCDVVCEVRPGELITVGGNVSNSVTVTRVKTDGRGYISDPNYFAVIHLGAARHP
jgi:peptidoglycan hydrolase-like protein with peptidoglycan-binding domain